MKDTCYLIADEVGVVRMTKRPPGLARGEIGVKITVQIPDGCFTKPVIGCRIDVPEDRVLRPTIEATVEEPHP